MADYSRDQLMQALRAADKAGDTQAATAIARRIKSMDSAQSAKPKDKGWDFVSGDYTPNALWHGFKSGVGDIVQGVGDVAGIVGNPLNAMINMATGSHLSTDLGKTARKASGLPDPVSSVASEINKFGVGMMIPVPGMGAVKKTPQMVASAASGAVTKAAAKPVTTAAQQVVKSGEQAGVRVMTSDVKPPRTFVGKSIQALSERVPVIGTGGARSAQQAERIDAVKNIMREYGAAHGDEMATPAIDGVMENFAKTRGAAVAQHAAAKRAVIDNIPGTVPVNNTIAAIDAKIGQLSNVGTDSARAIVAKLQDWKTALQGKDLPTIDMIREEMGKAFKDPSLAHIKDTGEKVLQSIYGPMKTDMGNFIKTAGGPEKLAQWNKANTVLSGLADELQVGTLRSVLRSGKGTPEDVARILFSNKPSLVRRLYNNLDDAGRAKAQTAILQQALEKSGGMEAISPEKFISQMGKLGKSMGVFFSPKDMERLNGFTRLLQATGRAGQASVMTNSGQQSVPFLIGAAGVSHPWFVGGGAVLGRIYESAPVRNMLIGLSKTKPGSKAETAILQRLAVPIAAIIEREGPNIMNAANDRTAMSAAASNETGANNQQQQQPLTQ